MSQKEVECSVHGRQKMGLLCTHLAYSLLDKIPVDFYEHDEGDMGRPDAWCNQCEQAWELTETEEDRENWFLNCDHKIVCAACWDEAKELNSQ
ncbi:hypothetical protein [Elizabethkingia meningoseptica]|uniref:hypothetical protein n=1 Tax=Elizabethkingia meningoseptica TaxID=238 RepID=UPI0030173C62